MLEQIKTAAIEARLSGFKATADALEMFANTHIEMTERLFAVEGERAKLDQEKDIGIGRRGASAENC